MCQHKVIICLTLLVVGAAIYSDPIAQDPTYHDFADQLTFWGIPNFLNVTSNLAFVFVGLWGVKKYRTEIVCEAYKWPYLMLSVGILLTAFGSGWYHLFPSNQSLVWDRLPMTVAFMSLFSLIIRDYVHEKVGQKIFIPALLFGIASIIYWHITEQMSAGDLRPYILVQFLPLLLIPFIMILYRPEYGSRYALGLALLFYLAAKGAEYFDANIYDFLGYNISGHSIKHLLAAIGSYYALKVFLTASEDSHYAPPVPRG